MMIVGEGGLRQAKNRHLVLLGLFLLVGPGAHGQPVLFPEPLSPRIANYRIDVQLDPETRRLKGRQVLTWYNKTGETLSHLEFHLYLNAFRNNRTTFIRESGGVMRGAEMGEDGWGYIDVDRIALSDPEEMGVATFRLYEPGPESDDWESRFPLNVTAGRELTEMKEFIQPDDGNELDTTVFKLPLPVPLAPGEAVSLDFEFTALLPTPPFARTGAKEEYFFVGQWFPKIGVFDRGAWNCHQFHAETEFFADFGVYDVRITLPEEFIVGATGLEIDVTDNGDGTATHYYHAEDVHDFAWTASPEFLVFTGRIQDVDIRALVQPDHAAQGQRHLEAAKVAVGYFQDHYGDYPYPNLTVVDPRRGAGGSGGMEYPTLITAGTFYRLPAGVRGLEAVIIHEFGHNFWYHLLASNEFEEAWLDEGINSYTTDRIMNDAYGPEADLIDFMGIRLSGVDMNRLRVIDSPKSDPVVRNAWQNYNRASYGANAYSKSALLLETLRHYLGPKMMENVLREYVERWRFKHPKTQDFIDVVNEVSGQDLSWYFDQALYSNAVLDYAVTAVTSTAIEERGHFSEVREPQPETTRYQNEIRVRRLGAFQFPVELEIVFEDGETIREAWDGRELWQRFRYVRTTQLVSATVDPERKIPLDVNYTNNSRTLEKQRLEINQISRRWLFLWQCLLDLLSL